MIYFEGIVISFSAVATSIVMATLMDNFRKRMKIAILILLSASGVLFIFSTLVMENVISSLTVNSFKIVIYILLVGGVSLTSSVAPIAFEFCVELCYPVHEGVIGNWLTLWFNLISGVYFGVFQIPGIGTRWINFVLPFFVCIPLPIVFLVDEQYRRSLIDD